VKIFARTVIIIISINFLLFNFLLLLNIFIIKFVSLGSKINERSYLIIRNESFGMNLIMS